MAAADLTAERLREILHYDPETGIFTWRVRTSRCVKIGSECSHRGSIGYVVIQILSTPYSAHRLAWLHVTGSWPIGVIDHINGVRDDNRFCNLRDVSNTENLQNRRRPNKNTSSGFLGVHRVADAWVAQIGVNGRNTHIGIFKTPELAHAAYIEAKKNLHQTCTV